ncbi:UDP-glycosyltransferase 71B6 [Striga hermonthica]|uniref:Glycosyltransferase n=1 Tax=Striga hermonthica TaxID=68872 RepID=A0A9N7MPN6_STRHE|nr:UDP-glycosyltransferase 71B6 [Striga hermonthica]
MATRSQNPANLIFIPFPIISHQAAAVQTAGLLVDRNPRLTATIIVMKLPVDTKTTTPDHNPRIRFVKLPPDEQSFAKCSTNPNSFTVHYPESHKGRVRDTVMKIINESSPHSGRVAGFVVDMFCTAMIDVANELGLPSYIFYTGNASNLGLSFGLQEFIDRENKDLANYENTDFELSIPIYASSVPAKVWPTIVFEKESNWSNFTRKFRGAEGIVVNTFLELEPRAIRALSEDKATPPVYPVGPIIESGGRGRGVISREEEVVMRWLDGQPDSSVVFLCFGSAGWFGAEQVKEIAEGLENSRQRFLWSLRKPAPEGKFEFPGEYDDPREVLPEGFLEQTVGFGKVIGWAPQMAVLAHRAVGGFVSHCGWNSVLESVWFGVPLAAWPIYAEQQANAFQLVRELGIAVEIKVEYNMKSCNGIVPAGRIEGAVRELMGQENEGRRAKVRALSGTSRAVMSEGGSSYDYLGRFIDSVLENIS